LSSSMKQLAKPTTSRWRFRLESAIARIIAEVTRLKRVFEQMAEFAYGRTWLKRTGDICEL
jgi:hypothetical protein